MKFIIILILALIAAVACFDYNIAILFIFILTFFVLSRVYRDFYIIAFLFIFMIPDDVLFYYSNNMPEYGFGWLRVHPIVPAVIVISAVYLIENGNKLARIISKSIWDRVNFIILALFLIFAALQTIIFRGFQGMTVLVENYLAPIMLMMYVYIDFVYMPREQKGKRTKRIYQILAIIVVLIALYGIGEYFLGRNVVYEQALRQTTWGKMITGASLYRITTFFGHPLKNSYYFLFSYICGLLLFCFPFNIIIPLTSIIAILFTGSRGAFFLVIAVVPVIFFLKKIRPDRKILIGFAIAMCMALLFFRSSFTEMLFYRLSHEQASVSVRVDTLTNLVNLIRDHLLLGGGFGSSIDISRNVLSVKWSFENPWAMMIVDVGFLTTLLYLTFLLRVLWAAKRSIDFKFILFMVLFISLSTFSSHFRNTMNFIFLFNVGMIMADLNQEKEREVL